MTAAVSRPEFLTFSTTAEAIRARVDAARRMMELAQVVSDAEVVRCATAVALADMAARGEELGVVTAEYAKTAAAVVYAQAAYQQASDELTEVRGLTSLSA